MIEITGDRLVLRSMTREEYHAFWRKYTADPLMDPNPYRYDAAREDARYERALSRADWYPEVGIFTKEDGIIGQLSFKRIDLEKSRCELGIMLANDGYKGRGYGSEAFALAVGYAFETLGLRRIYADTMGSNTRMQRILDALGFRCYLRLEDCYDMNGRWDDRLDYVLERDEG